MSTKRILNEILIDPFTEKPAEWSFGAKKDPSGRPLVHKDDKGQTITRLVNNERVAMFFEVEDLRVMDTALAIRVFVRDAYPIAAPDAGSVLKPPTAAESDVILEIMDALKAFRFATTTAEERQGAGLTVIEMPETLHQKLMEAMTARGPGLFGGLSAFYRRAMGRAAPDHRPPAQGIDKPAAAPAPTGAA